MRPIARIPLPPTEDSELQHLSQAVLAATDPKVESKRLWDNKPVRLFETIRGTLQSMASGRARCMYCEDSYATDIEHFWPKSGYPLHTFDWLNYLLACSHCNSNLKRNLFPLDPNGDPLLIDPTSEDPRQHLTFIPSTGEFVEKSPKGKESIDVFGLNDSQTPRKLPAARKATLRKLGLLLKNYDVNVRAGQQSEADEIKAAVVLEPFSAVFVWLIETAKSPGASLVLGPELPGIIRRHRIDWW